MTTLALVKQAPQTLETMSIEQLTFNSADEMLDYLKKHPFEDLALDIIETWFMVGGEYPILDIESMLTRLKQQDSGRYQVMKQFMETCAAMDGQVFADLKLIGPGYKQRIQEVDKYKKLGRLGRIAWRAKKSLSIFFADKSTTAEIERAAQLAGELQLMQSKVLEAKKIIDDANFREANSKIKANEIIVEASNARRLKLEEADQQALEISNKSRREAKDEAKTILLEAEQRRTALEIINGQLEAVRLVKLETNPELALTLLGSQDKVQDNLEHRCEEFLNMTTASGLIEGADTANAFGINRFQAASITIAFYQLLLKTVVSATKNISKDKLIEILANFQVKTLTNGKLTGRHQIAYSPAKMVDFKFLNVCVNRMVKNPDKVEQIVKLFYEILVQPLGSDMQVTIEYFISTIPDFVKNLNQLCETGIYPDLNSSPAKDQSDPFAIDTHELPSLEAAIESGKRAYLEEKVKPEPERTYSGSMYGDC